MTQGEILARLFDELLAGHDIPSAESVCKVSAAKAFEPIDPIPYSFATNLQHTVLWQNFWLSRLEGSRAKPGMNEWKNDFREPAPEEYDGLRRELIEGLKTCRAIAAGEIKPPADVSNEAVVRDLILVAVHGAYHLGQLNLIKRAGNKKRTAK